MAKPTKLNLDLNLDQREALVDLAQHYAWPALLKAIDELVVKQEQAVLTFDIEGGGIDRFVHAKLRAEGARKLRADIEHLTKLLKKQER